jgi:hypothetical protein
MGRSRFTALVLGCIAVAVAACDDDDGRRQAEALATVTRTTSGVSTATAGPATGIGATTPTPPAPLQTTASAILGAAASPTEASTTPPAAASRITITFARLDCEAYDVLVRSAPNALYKVHWTTTSPADPATANSVSDHEVSQSPGEHTFNHQAQNWAHEGSNRLSVTAWDIDGVSFNETREIDC